MKNQKERLESKDLRIYQILNARSKLSDEDLAYLSYLETGFIREKKFDEWTSKLSDNWLFLNDLLFECYRSEFQIDSIGINGETIYLFEVKILKKIINYIEGDRWYKPPKTEIKNPYEQLKRTESMLRKLLNEHKLHFKIKPHLVFVNSEFFYTMPP
ncbi:nuclease-related domain-containing protein [Gottfriedia sp. NPDC057991]|uniref:nuclease-related domain-containing protein n=1 Tax=Gottfriedia sp. NPDC057991 TaxID=3346298 RepID=UPI0036DF7925